jgi:hypothetical protein
MAQTNLATAPLRRELEPGESVDRDRVRIDAAHVAQRDRGVTPLQQRADTLAQPGEVVPSDWARDCEGERFRCRSGHLNWTVRRAGTHRRPTDEFADDPRSYLQMPTHVTDLEEL